MDERGALSIPDFCSWAGIGRTKAYEEMIAGRLRAKKVEKRTLNRVDDAKAWLAKLPPAKAA